MEKSKLTQNHTQKEQLLNKKCSECFKDIKVSIERVEKYGSFLCDECKIIKKQKKINKQIHSVIPKKFWTEDTEKSLDKYKDKLCSLFIHGKTGTGKTMFTCSLIKEYIKKGYEVKFISYPSFMTTLQGMFKNSEANVYDYAKKIAWYPDEIESNPTKELREGVLIIDDLYAIKITDFVKSITHYIINEREMRVLPTIITANISLNEITEIDPRVSSRISGMCERLKFEGIDKRDKERRR